MRWVGAVRSLRLLPVGHVPDPELSEVMFAAGISMGCTCAQAAIASDADAGEGAGATAAGHSNVAP